MIFFINYFLNKLFSAFTLTPGKNDEMLKIEVPIPSNIHMLILKQMLKCFQDFFFQLLIYLALIFFTILNLKSRLVCCWLVFFFVAISLPSLSCNARRQPDNKNTAPVLTAQFCSDNSNLYCTLAINRDRFLQVIQPTVNLKLT